MLKIGGWNVTEKLMDRGERLWPPYAYLYISPFSLDLFGSFSIYIYPFSGRFHKFVRKDVRHRGCVKLVRRLRKNLYLFDTFHAYRDFSFRLIYIDIFVWHRCCNKKVLSSYEYLFIDLFISILPIFRIKFVES